MSATECGLNIRVGEPLGIADVFAVREVNRQFSGAASLKSPSPGAFPVNAHPSVPGKHPITGSVRSFMRVVCSWCQRELPSRECEPAMNGQLSHGMCVECSAKWLKSGGTKL